MLKPGQANQAVSIALLGFDIAQSDRVPVVEDLRTRIARHARIVCEDFSGNGELPPHADIAVVFGGDGSILRAAQRLYGLDLPVLGVNLGKLGFLADIQPQDIELALERVAAGAFRLIDHVLLAWELWDHDRLVRQGIGVNELAVLSGPPFRIQEIDLYVDGLLAASYCGDGLIVSTPIGSTAHNLSAGGPIVRRELPAFVISAISPHTLTVRPVVDSADRHYELRVRQPNQSTSVVVDGQVIAALAAAHCVRLTRAAHVFRMVEVAGHDYYRTLRERLGWGLSLTDNRHQGPHHRPR